MGLSLLDPARKNCDLVKTLAPCDLHQQDSSDVKQRSGVPTSKLLGGLAIPGAYLEWWLVSIAGTHGQQTSGRGMGTLGGSTAEHCLAAPLRARPSWVKQRQREGLEGVSIHSYLWSTRWM